MEKDYTKYSFRITFLVIILMLGITFIPPFSAWGVKFKRANIISDIYKFGGESREGGEAELNVADRAFIEEMEEAEKAAAAIRAVKENTESKDNETGSPSDTWELGVGETPVLASNAGGGSTAGSAGSAGQPEQGLNFANVVEIEDFSEGDTPSVADLCGLLGTATEKRLVRFGFLGDSYIEGDIITADVRDQLQSKYGGRGVGFVVFDTPLAQNRPTVKHTSGGWQNYSLIYKKSAPDNVRDRFFVSGTISVPSEGAWSRYESTAFRRNLTGVTSVRLLFTNTQASGINMVVNDTIERNFTPEASELVQQINVLGGNIKSVKVTVSDPDGFYGYGILMESERGVAVDNYSIRSNSGLALFGTSAEVNTRINSMLGYDVIVLQYGLNAMDPEMTGYKSYGEQFRKMINYMKSCFPRSVIIVMSVGDRSMQQDGEFVSMPAVKAMVAEQRAAAMDCGVAFWNTFMAMGGENSMSRFVENGWAAKDYTHLSFSGGRKIAGEFVKALEYAKLRSMATAGQEETVTAGYGDAIAPTAQRLDTFTNISGDSTGTNPADAGRETAMEDEDTVAVYENTDRGDDTAPAPVRQ